ncbi:hypothetical protein A2415_02450 [candidate division WWE3 bacterium RIFOXYC1_FULL_39_7]|uniref:Uncharacterized protein n=2 Tax=Katanobacteria TaxID=422282 RepID=A0A1F4X784_UNCKA|nr:MAG: hypothetical protein A2415_02450 [candidate division WWE3 bacterium RIFOXYC1_FULL_39_7]OGC77570.1 MAG: hypothetical protein A2619_01055 [candidate division WWE3 bacterium RIFOXYD1_FULL_39_9]
MPNVLLLVLPEYESEIKRLLPLLGIRLRIATAEALGDVNPEQVGVMALPVIASDNATPMQIFAIGSESLARRKLLAKWRLNLAKAWRKFSQEYSIHWGSKVDVWPTLPPGMWGMADDASIASMESKLEATTPGASLAYVYVCVNNAATAEIIFTDALGWKREDNVSLDIPKASAVMTFPGEQSKILLIEAAQPWDSYLVFRCSDIRGMLALLTDVCEKLDTNMGVSRHGHTAKVFMSEIFPNVTFELTQAE